ncbi:MAG: rhodanese-like domain-containing protein [Candidatus Binataceae bacterium]
MSSQVDIAVRLPEVPEISLQELRKRLKSGAATLVDVLSPESYATGHIPGAVSLPLEQVLSRAPELLPDRNAEIVVYCGKFT